MSTLRINLCISAISVHKDGANVSSLSAMVVYEFILLGNDQYMDVLQKIAP